MNTQEVVKRVQQVGGGLALLSAAGFAYAVSRRFNHRLLYERPFDPKNMVELKGTVLEISNSKEKKDEKRGVFLMLKADKDQVAVHLGPFWYINRQHHFKKGDKLKVKGSKVTYDNAEVVVASEIQQGKMGMTLRDEKGNPVWQSWHKM